MFRTSLLAAAFTVGCLSAASAATIDFRATMSGKSEVPPTTSTGSGDVLATLDTSQQEAQLHYDLHGLERTGDRGTFPRAGGSRSQRRRGRADRHQSAQPVQRVRDPDRRADQGPGGRQVVCECAYRGQQGRRNPRPDDARRSSRAPPPTLLPQGRGRGYAATQQAPRACSRRSARSIHCAVSFSCAPFCASRSCSAGKVHPVQRLVLIEAGEHHRPLAGRRIDLRLQALGADLLHHALHRRVDRADRGVAGLQQTAPGRRAAPRRPPASCGPSR